MKNDDLVQGNYMFIEFGAEFDEAFFYGFSPLCLLYNTRDDNTEAPHNYASKCIYVKGM